MMIHPVFKTGVKLVALLLLVVNVVFLVHLQKNRNDGSTIASTLDQKSLDDTEPPVSPLASEYPSFYVITAIFNPVSFSSRYDNYHKFAAYLESSGVQLITVEAIFPALNQTEFQVTSKDNPNHIQLRSESVFWMKENLINIGVSSLPEEAKYVAWLDADVYFEESNWPDFIIERLSEYAVVQVFRKADFLGPEGQEGVVEVERSDFSFGYTVVKYQGISEGFKKWYPHPGFGWAMTISAFKEMGGLPECNVVGGGDQHFAYAMLNRVQTAKPLPKKMKGLMQSEATQIHDRLTNWMLQQPQEMKGIVGYAPLTLKHRWHGSRKDRNYVMRWNILTQHEVNCKRDMRRVEDTGLLTFKEGTEDLQGEIVHYFKVRNEDGASKDNKDR